MRINTNVAALNSYNQLKNTQNNLSKSLQRLSSGKRINGAADDAAGLAISEKMKSQTRGLAQAQRNAQDGISMIQTAEGALKESHSILQRMRELAVQSANDTNTTADRAEIQKEVDQLAKELTRISNTTEFNTQSLLNGAVKEDGTGKATFQIGANSEQNIDLSINAMDAESLGVAADATIESDAITGTATGGDAGTIDFDVNGTTATTSGIASGDSGGAIATKITNAHSGITASFDTGTDQITITAATGSTVEITGGTAATLSFAGLEVGDTAGASSSATFSGGTTTDAFAAAGIDVSTQTKADAAITKLDTAIADVSAERSKLGAYQNRLDHTINNLSAAEENLTAAESRISDVDMAKEMMNFTKSQILSQAGTAMLAQANQLPQGVLQLLG
jgi:flagellin